MRWAAVLQKQLLEIAWPEVVLEWPMCAEVYDHENNVGGQEALLWKGLRVRIGMACGKPQYRKPLNTGIPLDQAPVGFKAEVALATKTWYLLWTGTSALPVSRSWPPPACETETSLYHASSSRSIYARIGEWSRQASSCLCFKR